MSLLSTGEVIGWITLIVNGLFAAVCFMVALMAYDNCSLFHDEQEKNVANLTTDTPIICTDEGKKMFIELSLLMGLISVAYILFGYKCIIGVRKVNIFSSEYSNSCDLYLITPFKYVISARLHENQSADKSSILQRGILWSFQFIFFR